MSVNDFKYVKVDLSQKYVNVDISTNTISSAPPCQKTYLRSFVPLQGIFFAKL